MVLCLLLFLPGTAVVASGQAEPRLQEVQKLIQQQDYTTALKMLVDIQRKDPSLRDETTKLIGQIMAVTQKYNSELEQLNKAIDAGNVEDIPALLSQLQRTDPRRAAEAIPRMRTVVGFLRLMNDAQASLARGRSLEALSTYLLVFTDPSKAGFTLPQAEFESAGYGEILVGSVRGSLAAILAAAGQGVKIEAGISRVVPSLKSLVSQTPTAESLVQFDEITAPLVQEARAEGAVRKAVAAILDVDRAIQQTSDTARDDPYLRYLLWMFLGRGKSPEGIAYAMHRLWADAAEEAAVAAGDSATAAFQSARSLFSSGALSRADAAFQLQPERSAMAVKAAALSLARFDIGPAGGWSLPDPDSKAARDTLDRALQAQEMSDEAEAYRLLISYRGQLEALPAVAGVGGQAPVFSPGTSEIDRLTSARAALEASASAAQAQEATWNARADRWTAQSDISVVAAAIAGSSRGIAELFGSFLRSNLQPRDQQYALRIAQITSSGFPGRLQTAVSQRTQAEDLKDGTVNGVAPPAGSITKKHPDQALPLLSSASEALDTLVSDILSEEQKLEGEKPYVKSTPTYAALLGGSAEQPGLMSLLQQARSEQARVEALVASARKQADAAALSSREGDNNFALAQAALNRRDPDGATSALELATAAYLRSLADEYTEHASARTTTEADALNAKILDLQNALSVASAQKAVTAINKLIAARDFLGASDALDAALREWSQTQTGSYPPFDILRQDIQAAVQLSQGREISRLDPKADVVNAFIKNAQDNLAAGKLTDAAQNVRDALAVAPNYGAAKVLQLMIKKRTDPASFEKDASAQIATYLKMGADKTNVEGQKTAYLALLDYSRLDPKFAAETKGPIQELEYSLGLARRPPTSQQVARSNVLVRQADLIQQQGTQEAYQQALDVLKQALQIDPENADAVRLDGLIRTRMGSTALAALSPADTQVYNQAFSLFLSGAYQDAYDRVMQVWNDPRSPRNKTYGPLQRLKKRLEIQLNIS